MDPRSKPELLHDVVEEHRHLRELLDSLTEEEKVRPGVVGEWSVKDLLAHLTVWHGLLVMWLEVGERGGIPEMPAPGYGWADTPDLNLRIYEDNRARSLTEIEPEFEESYLDVLARFESMSEADLLEEGRFAWTGHHSVATYAVPATCAHYEWARTHIVRALRARPVALPIG